MNSIHAHPSPRSPSIRRFLGLSLIFLLFLWVSAQGAPVVRMMYEFDRPLSIINPADPVGTALALVFDSHEAERLRERPGFPLGFTRAYPIHALASPNHLAFVSVDSLNGDYYNTAIDDYNAQDEG